MNNVTRFAATVICGVAIVLGTGALISSCSDNESPTMPQTGQDSFAGGVMDSLCADCQVSFGGDDVWYYVRNGVARTDVENMAVGDQVVLRQPNTLDINHDQYKERYCIVTWVDQECCRNPNLRCTCFTAWCNPATEAGVK